MTDQERKAREQVAAIAAVGAYLNVLARKPTVSPWVRAALEKRLPVKEYGR